MTGDGLPSAQLRDAGGDGADCRRRLRNLAEPGGGVVVTTQGTIPPVGARGPDAKTAALACLAALVALRAAPASYRRGVEVAFGAGASVDEVVGTLEVVARTVGLARVVAAAPGLAVAAGYDIDAALEAWDEPRAPGERG